MPGREWQDGRLAGLRDILLRYERVIVAFSGGIDSLFLLHCCARLLGRERVIAVTAASETYTPDELAQAQAAAAQLGVRHAVLHTEELSDPQFAANPENRCYYCKHWFYKKVAELARAEHIAVICDGTNADDLGDYRPGREAAREFGVHSPLVDAGIGKQFIRDQARAWGIAAWNKPANPCLASRIPYGEVISVENLAMVARAEAFVRGLGFADVRVRHHGKLARLELPRADFAAFFAGDTAAAAARALHEAGYTWVAFDLDGYRTGSMNAGVAGAGAHAGPPAV